MKRNSFLVKKRLIFILSVFTLMLVILMIRVGFIQIVNSSWYKQKAFAQQNREMPIPASRGTIYDRNGIGLALSANVNKISVSPAQIKKNEIPLDEIAEGLARVLDKDKNWILKRFKRKSSYELIVRQVEEELTNDVRKFAKDNEIRGIYISEDTKRYYPNERLASHVIGFTNYDNNGAYGIEMKLDKYLNGVPGKILSEVDASGIEVPFNEEKRIQPQDGLSVHLTIDEAIQNILQKELEIAIDENKVLNGAAGIVIDPMTGDILAMVSKPDFDLNNPKAAPIGVDKSTWVGTTDKDIKTLQETVWRNKAVTDTYEPGSTFKAITTVAGLEEGVVNLNTPTSDKTIRVLGIPINCWKPNGHGDEPFYLGLYNSCNPVFVKVALDLGQEKFYKYIRTFGFYEKTGIVLPGEAKGIFHAKTTELDMAVASFGQRFEITPIQLSLAYGAIVNGGKLMKPRLVTKLTNKEGVTVKSFEPEVVRACISKQTSDTIKGALEGVVANGGGRNAYVIGARVGGKTGTSETRVEGQYIASFSGFAPADNPRIHVLVMLDNPTGDSYYGGIIAAPVAARIIDQTLRYLNVEKRYTEKDKKMIPEEVNIPNVRGKTIKEAKAIFKDVGLECKIETKTGEEKTIMDQMPKPGVSIEKKSLVILYTYQPENEVMVTVPDVDNRTITQATIAFKNAGLNLRISGVGKAVKQSRAAGERVPAGSIIDVKFRFLDTD